MNSDDLYKIKYYKYKKKYITLKNSNVSNMVIQHNKRISDIRIPCIDNEKCNKTGSQLINNRWAPCEGWNCL